MYNCVMGIRFIPVLCLEEQRKGAVLFMKRLIGKLVIICGFGFSIIGLYLLIFKAGIPYQDPTQIMINEWLIANRNGKIFLTIGAGMMFVSIILFRRKKNR